MGAGAIFSTTGTKVGNTAGAGEIYFSTGVADWITADAGARNSTAGVGDWITVGAGEMYSTAGAGAPRRFPNERIIKIRLHFSICALAILSQNGHGVLLLLLSLLSLWLWLWLWLSLSLSFLLLFRTRAEVSRMCMSTIRCTYWQEPSMTKNSSPSRAPKNGAQLQTTWRSAKNAEKPTKNPSPPPYPR